MVSWSSGRRWAMLAFNLDEGDWRLQPIIPEFSTILNFRENLQPYNPLPYYITHAHHCENEASQCNWDEPTVADYSYCVHVLAVQGQTKSSTFVPIKNLWIHSDRELSAKISRTMAFLDYSAAKFKTTNPNFIPRFRRQTFQQWATFQ